MTISTTAFAKHNHNTEMCTEASTIGWPALYNPPIFTLKSEWTQRNISMERVGIERNDEGEPLVWIYKPSNKSIKLTVEVFND